MSTTGSSSSSATGAAGANRDPDEDAYRAIRALDLPTPPAQPAPPVLQVVPGATTGTPIPVEVPTLPLVALPRPAPRQEVATEAPLSPPLQEHHVQQPTHDPEHQLSTASTPLDSVPHTPYVFHPLQSSKLASASPLRSQHGAVGSPSNLDNRTPGGGAVPTPVLHLPSGTELLPPASHSSTVRQREATALSQFRPSSSSEDATAPQSTRPVSLKSDSRSGSLNVSVGPPRHTPTTGSATAGTPLQTPPPAAAAAPAGQTPEADLESSGSSIVSLHRADALPPLVPTLRPDAQPPSQTPQTYAAPPEQQRQAQQGAHHAGPFLSEVETAQPATQPRRTPKADHEKDTGATNAPAAAAGERRKRAVFETQSVRLFQSSSSDGGGSADRGGGAPEQRASVPYSGTLRYLLDEETVVQKHEAQRRRDKYGKDPRFLPDSHGGIVADFATPDKAEKKMGCQHDDVSPPPDAGSHSSNALTPDEDNGKKQKRSRSSKRRGKSADDAVLYRRREERHRRRPDSVRHRASSTKEKRTRRKTKRGGAVSPSVIVEPTEVWRDAYDELDLVDDTVDRDDTGGRGDASSGGLGGGIPPVSKDAGPVAPLLAATSPLADAATDGRLQKLTGRYSLRNPSASTATSPDTSFMSPFFNSGSRTLSGARSTGNTNSYFVNTGAFSSSFRSQSQHLSDRMESDTVDISVCVRGISPMHADIGVTHPFVRVWALNCQTGINLVAGSERFGLTHPFDLRSHRSRVPFWDCELIIPLSVPRVVGKEKHTVLIFEVLECGNEDILGYYRPRPGIYPICWGYYMLYDNFGRPNVTTRTHTVDVQMFPYPSREPWYYPILRFLMPLSLRSDAFFAPTEEGLDYTGVLLPTAKEKEEAEAHLKRRRGARNSSGEGMNTSVSFPSMIAGTGRPPHVPEVVDIPGIFDIFSRTAYRSLRYASALTVSIKLPSARGTVQAISVAEGMLPYEEFLMETLRHGFGSCITPIRDVPFFLAGARGLRGRSKSRDRARSRRSMSVMNPDALGGDFESAGNVSLPPTTVLQTIAVNGLVTCVAFSDDGEEFSIGITRNLRHIVERRYARLEEAPVISTLVGHTGHVHRVVYSGDDEGLILSCSSDKTVKIWRRTSGFSLPGFGGSLHAIEGDGGETLDCLCTFPHSFPVYCAVFHHGHVVTGGYDSRILTWRYGSAVARAAPAAAAFATNVSFGSLTLPDSSTTAPSEAPATNSGSGIPAGANLGELVCQTSVDTEDPHAFVLCLASRSGSSRLWSVSSRSQVLCWRALTESRGDRTVWFMSLLRQQPDVGNGDVADLQVQQNTALVLMRNSPMVFTFDAASGAPLQRINMGGVPRRTSPLLTSDGRLFLLLATDGTYRVWDCDDGGLCTPTEGYTGTRTGFEVERVAAAASKNLYAYVSVAPCPETQVFAALQPLYQRQKKAQEAAGDSDTESVEMLDLPVEVTVVSILGTSASSLLGHAMDRDNLCAVLGGNTHEKSRCAQRAKRQRLIAVQKERSESNRERQQEMFGMNRETAVAAAAASSPRRGFGFRRNSAPVTTSQTGAGSTLLETPFTDLPLDDATARGTRSAAANAALALRNSSGDGLDPEALDVYETMSRLADIRTFWSGFRQRIAALRRAHRSQANSPETEPENDLP